jgi:hypothetical protein
MQVYDLMSKIVDMLEFPHTYKFRKEDVEVLHHLNRKEIDEEFGDFLDKNFVCFDSYYYPLNLVLESLNKDLSIFNSHPTFKGVEDLDYYLPECDKNSKYKTYDENIVKECGKEDEGFVSFDEYYIKYIKHK